MVWVQRALLVALGLSVLAVAWCVVVFFNNRYLETPGFGPLLSTAWVSVVICLAGLNRGR